MVPRYEEMDDRRRHEKIFMEERMGLGENKYVKAYVSKELKRITRKGNCV